MSRPTVRLLAGMTGLALLAADPAVAQTCFTLQAELQHLQNSGGGGDRQRYERAYREQARVMARTEARARNAGCFGGGFMFFRREPDRACRTLLSKLGDMQDNMVRLDRMRRRSGNGNARRIRAIQALMRERQCGRPGAEENRIPGERIYEGDGQLVGRGTYRTLCVRSCDGYYFPISFSTTRQQFAEDAATCMAMCPGAEVDLYYHANPGSGPEDMVSLRGENYSSLPAAFQYRTKLDPSCTCKPAGGNQSIAADPGARPSLEPLQETAAAPLPGPLRPEPGEDPETLLNRLGQFVPRVGSQNVAAAPKPGSVRIVGPVFGTSPEQEGVVLTPVPN